MKKLMKKTKKTFIEDFEEVVVILPTLDMGL